MRISIVSGRFSYAATHSLSSSTQFYFLFLSFPLLASLWDPCITNSKHVLTPSLLKLKLMILIDLR
jgi:hypothetical protein